MKCPCSYYQRQLLELSKIHYAKILSCGSHPFVAFQTRPTTFDHSITICLNPLVHSSPFPSPTIPPYNSSRPSFNNHHSLTSFSNMSNDQRAITTTNGVHHQGNNDEDDHFRDIHALTPTPPPSSTNLPPRRRFDSWESVASEAPSSENFTTMSREFNNLVLAGTTIGNESEYEGTNNGNSNLGRIGEEESMPEDTNPLAIVPDNSRPLNPVPSPGHARDQGTESTALVNSSSSVQRVKKEEVETKISAWQTAKIAKINNRFKRDDAVINGWENEQVQKATSWMKKIERKLEERRAKAQEKMQNDIAKARRKAEEKRASAEAKRGTKVAKVLELSNLMRAVGRAPTKRTFF